MSGRTRGRSTSPNTRDNPAKKPKPSAPTSATAPPTSAPAPPTSPLPPPWKKGEDALKKEGAFNVGKKNTTASSSPPRATPTTKPETKKKTSKVTDVETNRKHVYETEILHIPGRDEKKLGPYPLQEGKVVQVNDALATSKSDFVNSQIEKGWEPAELLKLFSPNGWESVENFSTEKVKVHLPKLLESYRTVLCVF